MNAEAQKKTRQGIETKTKRRRAKQKLTHRALRQSRTFWASGRFQEALELSPLPAVAASAAVGTAATASQVAAAVAADLGQIAGKLKLRPDDYRAAERRIVAAYRYGGPRAAVKAAGRFYARLYRERQAGNPGVFCA